MFTQLKVKNIQSHKDTQIEFDPGINIIIGSSNNGKSALMRALNWVIYNRPLGTDTLASHWALDKKGNLNDEMSVELLTDDNFSVKRKRTKSDNQYIISNDEETSELNVVKSDVPVEVQDILCVSDVNIQRQMDAPFLLSETNGEVAKYFNKLVRLDVIDKVLSNAESKRRKIKSNIDVCEKLLTSKKETQNKFNWFEDVEKLICKYERIENKNNSINEQIETIETDLSELKKLNEMGSKLDNISSCSELITEFESLNHKTDELENKIKFIESNVATLNNQKAKINIDFTNANKFILKLNSIEDKIKTIDFTIGCLTSQINGIKDYSSHIEELNIKINNLKNSLPNICPICGNKLDKDCCL